VQYQTFRGSDLKEAISLVKAAFGSDAVIGATRSVSRNKGPLSTPYVEVAAAPAPEDTREANASARPVRPRKRGLSFRPTAPAPQTNLMERELRVLRSMVDELSHGRSSNQRAQALLHNAGIEGSLAQMLANGAEAHANGDHRALVRYLRQRVSGALAFADSPIEQPGPRLITCIGPSGAGKTTTLAKLAARARLDGKRSVSVITLDTFRVGAVAQWQRYSQILGMPMGVAHDADSFRRMLRDHNADIVLVDTAGRSADRAWQDPRVTECLAEASVPVDVLLVVPAWLRARDVERVTQVYAAPPPTGVVITKLDETECIGGSLHAVLGHTLPLTYLCNGPRVPEDIHTASIGQILDALFPSE